jgi:hypothetical protein
VAFKNYLIFATCGNVWALTNLICFEKKIRGALEGLCPLLNILREMKSSRNHFSDSQDHSMVPEKSILDD